MGARFDEHVLIEGELEVGQRTGLPDEASQNLSPSSPNPPRLGRRPTAEDAGATLTSLWRSYAAIAAEPYRIGSFRKEFRKWQSSTPPSPTAEFVASERYWRSRTHPRPDILVLGNGAALRIRGGHLEAYSLGITTRFAPGPHHRRPKAVIFAGWGGILSLAAVRFCIDHHITILATGWLGDLTTFAAPRPIQDAALVRAQCMARPAPIAREIVLQKFRHYLATARMSRAQFHDFALRLEKAQTLHSILTLEAVGSSLSWVHWEGLQLIPRTGRTLPAWLARPFQHRASGIGQSGVRHATDAINGMLNLTYSREAGRLGALLAASAHVSPSGSCIRTNLDLDLELSLVPGFRFHILTKWWNAYSISQKSTDGCAAHTKTVRSHPGNKTILPAKEKPDRVRTSENALY